MTNDCLLLIVIIRSGIRNVFHDAGALTVAQLVHKFPALYGTRMFLTALPKDINQPTSFQPYYYMDEDTIRAGLAGSPMPQTVPYLVLDLRFFFFQLHSVLLIKSSRTETSFDLVCYFPDEIIVLANEH
jgi:hypothetical protein